MENHRETLSRKQKNKKKVFPFFSAPNKPKTEVGVVTGVTIPTLPPKIKIAFIDYPAAGQAINRQGVTES